MIAGDFDWNGIHETNEVTAWNRSWRVVEDEDWSTGRGEFEELVSPKLGVVELGTNSEGLLLEVFHARLRDRR